MNLEKLKDSARKFEQKEDWRKAIEVYLKAIQQIESGAETSPDLSLYNRVGDLYLKINDTAAAVRSYERAVDLYADQGFFNNAIALCGKILRVNPGRTQTYLKLAQLHARKNVVIEAKRNLIEFLERMNALGQLDQAFQSVKEFADQFSGSQEIRMMLVELLRAASREEEALEQLAKIAGDLEARGPVTPARRAGSARRHAPATPARAPSPPGRGDLVFLDTGFDVPTVPADVVADVPAAPPATAAHRRRTAARRASSTRRHCRPAAWPRAALTRSAAGPARPASSRRWRPIYRRGAEPAPAGRPRARTESTGDLELEAEGPLSGPARERPLEARTWRSGALDDHAESQAPPTFADPISISTSRGRGGGGADGGPPADRCAPAGALGRRAGRTRGPDRWMIRGTPISTASSPTACCSKVSMARAAEELRLSLQAYEGAADWPGASAVAERLVALEPDAIHNHQKRVELAFRTGERAPLLEAYLALGDALGRAGATDKALAVYGRVQEHDPSNAPRGRRPSRALTGASPRQPPARGRRAMPAPPRRPVPGAARRRLRPSRRRGAASFVDLGSMIFDEAGPRDTRMRIDRREPQDEDEQREFQEILEQFKRGIDENLETDDYQAHYDLGVAFKEMGLLDEAIAEFQKALRAPEGRLRTSEALGIGVLREGAVRGVRGGAPPRGGWGGGGRRGEDRPDLLARPCARGAGEEPRRDHQLRARDGGGHPVHGSERPRPPAHRGAARMSSQIAPVTLADLQRPCAPGSSGCRRSCAASSRRTSA